MQSFDHDDTVECKTATSGFIEAYMNYRDYVQASDMKHSNSINSYAWFRNLRKLVKQSAFSMLLKALGINTQNIPEDKSAFDSVFIDSAKYESTIQKFYQNVIEAWGSIDGDSSVEECDELRADWNEMINFGNSDDDTYISNIFYKLNGNMRSFRRESTALHDWSETTDKGAHIIAGESRPFIKTILEFLRSVETALPTPILASSAFAEMTPTSASPTTASSSAGKRKAIDAPKRLSDRAMAHHQQLQIKSISGPRESAHTISSKMEEEEEERDWEREDGHGEGLHNTGANSSAINEPATKKQRTSDSDDEELSEASYSVEKARRSVKNAADAAVGAKRQA